MRRAASPAPPRPATAGSRKPTAAPCSSTSWRPCRRRRRTGCCARSNMARSPASARPSRSRSTCGSSPRPTSICRGWSSEGRFRADLLDRLSFEVVTLPPLRARKGDIPLLAEHFGRRMAVELDWPNWPGFSPRALAELEAYPWPGNVRELRNVVERAVYRAEDPERADRRDPVRSVRFALGARAAIRPARSSVAAHAAEPQPRAAEAQPLRRAAAGLDRRLPRRGHRL